MSINQTAPTVATDNAGAASTAVWFDALPSTMLDANGAVSSASPDSVLLPFTPQNGYVYTLTASVTFTGNPGSWVGAGFAGNYVDAAGTGQARFSDPGVVGYDWAILTESSGNLQYFAGPKGSLPVFPSTNSFFTAGLGTHTVVITLNTTAAAWTISCTVDGKQAGSTYTYTTNPVITAFGITQTTLSTTAFSDAKWNSISLTASGTPSPNAATATVSFSGTPVPLNPSFLGLSYEKQDLTTGLFTSANTPLINMFNLLGSSVLRIGGPTVDTTTWNGTSGTAITPAEVDSFAAFAKKLSPQLSVIYGINLENNTPAVAEEEAAYAQSDLGSSLFGFELGNEPDAYAGSSYSTFLTNWQAEESAITTSVPGWDKGTGSGGWSMDGPDEATTAQTSTATPPAPTVSTFICPFASNESGVVSQLTQHFFAGTNSDTSMQTILSSAYPIPPSTSTTPFSALDTLLVSNTIASPATTGILQCAQGNQALGARISEAGTMYGGGVNGVSNAFGSALWALDFMLTAAQNGVQGVNFHGGDTIPSSPINNNGATITAVGPEFYAMKMFSLIPQGGTIFPASATTVTLNNPSNSTYTPNFSAYGVQASNGTISAVLNNKEVNYTVSVSLSLGANVSNVELITLTAPNLFDTTGLTLGGAVIKTDGTWSGGVQQVLTASGGQVTVNVPPATAYLLIPAATAPPAASPSFSLAAGTYTSAQTVSLADATPGASIYYTTDGSTPTTSSTPYTGPIALSGTVGQTVTDTINAIAAAPGYSNSPVASSVYTMHLLPPAATPSFSLAAGTYTTVQTVSLSDSISGASIYYTTDGSTPTSSSTLYSGPITVPVTETINAIATATGYTTSAVGSAAYVINLPPPGFTITASNTTMTVSPNGGGSVTLTITANAAFNGTITFGCSWYVPVGATCQFVPATVTVNALGTTTTTFALAMPKSGLIASRRDPSPLLPVTMSAGVLCLLGFRKRRRLQMLLLIAVSAIGMSTFTACSTKSSLSPSSSQFVINATGSSLPVNAPTGTTPTSVSESLPMVLAVQ